MAHVWRGVLREYADRLGVTDASTVVTLGEGGTPLLPAPALSSRTGADVWVKYEGMNPTGSFKDRGMTVALSRAVEHGAKAVICASTGNTSASMAAYAAKAGLKPLVLVPEGKIAAGKMAQAIIHGAQVIMVRGNFDDCLTMARGLAWDYPVALVNSVNPVRLEGQKTAAFEIVDYLGDAPDYHLLPVGNAGNISAYWMGFREYHDEGPATRTPAMWGFQAAGAAPLVSGKPVASPETVATAIRIGTPASWTLAEQARDERCDDGCLRRYDLRQRHVTRRLLQRSVPLYIARPVPVQEAITGTVLLLLPRVQCASGGGRQGSLFVPTRRAG